MQAFIDVRVPGINVGTTEAHLQRTAFRDVDSVIGKLNRFLRPQQVSVSESIVLADNHASGWLVNRFGLPIDDDLAQAISEKLHEVTDEVKVRFGNAFRDQTSIERNSQDLAALAFNGSAEIAARNGAEIWFGPGRSWSWRYMPAEPRSLECATPCGIRYETISRGCVMGVRECGAAQQDLFLQDGLIDVIITLEHKHTEIRYRTSRAEAQMNIWTGVTHLSADVRIRVGDLPEVMGQLTLERD